MLPAPRFTWFTALCCLLVLACAGAARTWYLLECVNGGWSEPALRVQGDWPRVVTAEGKTYRGREQPTELDVLADNIDKLNGFVGVAPLSDQDMEETTAHVAPGYPWLLGMVTHYAGENADGTMRWLQCVLGTLTAGCCFFFARRSFHSTLIALIAGLLGAFHPFWVINTAEINDGVLATFLVSLCLTVGTRSSQTGGPVSGFFFGGALAGLCMVRGACLPFALIAALWFLWRCRRFGLGWLASVLMLTAFVNGLAPWAVRNYQLYGRPVPVVTTTYYHLWVGNNPQATGAALSGVNPADLLGPERAKELAEEPNQAKRYDKLGPEILREVEAQPRATLIRRILATLAFLFGDWSKDKPLVDVRGDGPQRATLPGWLGTRADDILYASLVGMLVLALLGWRVSHRWRVYHRLGTIAALFLPLPYILSHAETWSGPRLPYDGVLLCLAAYALASLIPGATRGPDRSRQPEPEPVSPKGK